MPNNVSPIGASGRGMADAFQSSGGAVVRDVESGRVCNEELTLLFSEVGRYKGRGIPGYPKGHLELREQFAIDTSASKVTSPQEIEALAIGQHFKELRFVNFVAPPRFHDEVVYDTDDLSTNDHILVRDTRRADLAEYDEAIPKVTTAQRTMIRRGFAGVLDTGYLNGQRAGRRERLRRMAQIYARNGVMFDIANVVQDLAVAAGSFAAGHDTTVGVGDEWTAAAANPQNQVQTGIVEPITSDGPADPTDIHLFFPNVSWQALIGNADFKAWRGQGAVARPGGLVTDDEAANYFGVGAVLHENAFATVGATTGELFGDDCIGFVPGPSGTFDDTFGTRRWIDHVTLNDGVMSDETEERKKTALRWFFDKWSDFRLVNNSMGAILRDLAT